MTKGTNSKELKEKLRKERLGEVNYNYSGERIVISEYITATNIVVMFDDGYTTKSAYKDFKIGCIKNPYSPRVYGVGYYGIGEYTSKYPNTTKRTIEYKYWHGIMQRCYDEKFKERHSEYKNTTVFKEWHNFQVFGDWSNSNYYEIKDEIMCLDKDILVKGNKIYSPDTCIFVPERINTLFTKTNSKRGNYPIGITKNKENKFIAKCSILDDNLNKVKKYLGIYNTPEDAFYNGYKPFKEKYIKQVANEYKDKIPQKLYDAMYNWKVEITD